MAINWDKEVKIMTKGLKLGKRTALDVWDQVVILGSKRYPHWNRRTGFIVKGLNNVKKNTGFSGRWEIISEKPLTILDVGHNSDAFKEILKELQTH